MHTERERCGAAPTNEGLTFICSYECTFCALHDGDVTYLP
jgi:hypothetical protein